MIEVIVHDVVARTAKSGEVKYQSAVKDSKVGPSRVILLKEISGPRILPIWVGPIESDVIALKLEQLELDRPTTFDLTTRLLSLGNTKLEKVAVTALRGKIANNPQKSSPCHISLKMDYSLHEWWRRQRNSGRKQDRK